VLGGHLGEWSMARALTRFLFPAVLGVVSCSDSGNVPLPDVRTPLAWDLGCPPSAFGVPHTQAHVLPPEDTPVGCVLADFEACHEGRVAYQLTIDSGGRLLSLAFLEPRSPVVEPCIERTFKQAVFVAALDCRLVPVESTFRGGIAWTRERGISVALPGLSGVIPASPSNCS
jgi:hypothetical protein